MAFENQAALQYTIKFFKKRHFLIAYLRRGLYSERRACYRLNLISGQNDFNRRLICNVFVSIYDDECQTQRNNFEFLQINCSLKSFQPEIKFNGKFALQKRLSWLIFGRQIKINGILYIPFLLCYTLHLRTILKYECSGA